MERAWGDPTMVEPLIKLKNISKNYILEEKVIKALNSINLEIPKGQITALVGESGCGKTTLLKILANLLKPDTGDIYRNTEEINPGVVFQDSMLLPWKSVEENLLLSLKRTQTPPLNKSEKHKRINEALSIVKLEKWKNSYPFQLSGGMAQRISLARALCQKKKFLLMDEPFSALDSLSREKLQVELKEIQSQMGYTILFITHDISEAILLADKIIVMKDGEIKGEVNGNIELTNENLIIKLRTLLGFNI